MFDYVPRVQTLRKLQMNLFIISRTKIYSILTVGGVILLAAISGWKVDGLDRSNYLSMLRMVELSDGFTEKLFFAKDTTFLLITIFSGYFSDDVRVVFLLVCSISIFTKYFAIKTISIQHLLPFFLLYAIFLTPGLEFAAMRGGLAIGFLILALIYFDKYFLFFTFSLLAIASHIAMAPVIIMAYRPINKFLENNKIAYVIIFVFVLMIGEKLIAFFPHGSDYKSNRGTVFSYALPMATLIISQLIFYRFEKAASIQSEKCVLEFLKILKPVIYGLIAIAFGISGIVVTASTRYLEIAWFLLLLPALVLYKKTLPNFLGLLAWIALLLYINIQRSTWLAIIYPEKL